MKRIFYYTTTALVLSCGVIQAQTCVPTPTCNSLGYTSSTACDGGLKCPFGEAWNCDLNKITEITNKITEIEKKIEQQQQQEKCIIGSILYEDKTCSLTVIAGKTPIGIVVYIDSTGGQAMALKSLGNFNWGDRISTLPDFGNNAGENYTSCENSKKIIEAGDKSKYPAAWAAHEYKTEGTSAGDWCLPAAGIFTSYYNNQDIINLGFAKVGGIKFIESTQAWSSTPGNTYYRAY